MIASWNTLGAWVATLPQHVSTHVVDWLTWMFLATNLGAVLAYVTQIRAAARCQHGALAVSVVTWFYFASARFASSGYAIWVLGDVSMALIFLLNFALCVALLAVVLVKRLAWHRRSCHAME